MSIIDKTRLIEEVPGVPDDEAYFIWSGTEHRTIWHGPTRAAGEKWASDNGITIEEFEGFEP